MLTPKMSIRRKNVIKAYEQLIEDVYSGRKGHRIGNQHRVSEVV
jgi:hypothetical protein